MEQKFQNWKNLNPMYYWQFVMKKKADRLPCVVIKGDPTVSVVRLIQQYQNYPIHWIIEDGQEISEIKNILYRDSSHLSYHEWVKNWSSVDFLICKESEKDYWMVALLCGVSVIFDDNIQDLPSIQVLSSVDRIENWEKAKNLLT